MNHAEIMSRAIYKKKIVLVQWDNEMYKCMSYFFTSLAIRGVAIILKV